MAYIDKMPWEAGGVGAPVTLSTSTQAKADFPDATKTATGSLDTTGLAAGRHMAYVQGTNDDGKAGALSASFLDVTAAPVVTPPADSGGGGAMGWAEAALMLLGLTGLGALGHRARRARGGRD